MYTALSPGAVGVHPESNAAAAEAARRHGFDGVEFNPSSLAATVEREGAEAAQALFGGLKPAGFGLTVEWRKDEETYRSGLAELPRLAQAASAVGCTRCTTWVLPGSDERALDENLSFHRARFGPVAEILGTHGIRFGLEFIGPKTLRDRFAHPFVYRMEDMLALAGEIGPNVGLLVDGWHWYTSGGTVEELRRLTNEQIVYVHVNDAPAGVPVDEQLDNVRCLPGETGVIDNAAFIGTLREIGYDGPVVVEPFKKELADLPDDDARLTAVRESLRKIGL